MYSRRDREIVERGKTRNKRKNIKNIKKTETPEVEFNN